MEKLVVNDFSKTLILLGLGFAGIFALFINTIIRLKGSFKPYQKSTIVYLIVTLLSFALLTWFFHWIIAKNYLAIFICYQAGFLFLGILHTYWMQQHLNWSGTKNALWAECSFTFMVAITGTIVLVLLYRLLYKEALLLDMAASIIMFIIPWFFYQSFQSAVAIPSKILRQWYYPVSNEIAEPDERKLKHLLIISFEFQKKVTDKHFTNFRAKAPVDMDLGELFYYFVNDYNDRHPHAKIEYIDTTGEPHGWVFYKKKKWFALSTNYIDAEKTVFKNSIKENDIIICSRWGT